MGFHFTGGALFIATRRRATGECPYAVCKKSVILSEAKNLPQYEATRERRGVHCAPARKI